jgi:hypothetical protein
MLSSLLLVKRLTQRCYGWNNEDYMLTFTQLNNQCATNHTAPLPLLGLLVLNHNNYKLLTGLGVTRANRKEGSGLSFLYSLAFPCEPPPPPIPLLMTSSPASDGKPRPLHPWIQHLRSWIDIVESDSWLTMSVASSLPPPAPRILASDGNSCCLLDQI